LGGGSSRNVRRKLAGEEVSSSPGELEDQKDDREKKGNRMARAKPSNLIKKRRGEENTPSAVVVQEIGGRSEMKAESGAERTGGIWSAIARLAKLNEERKVLVTSHSNKMSKWLRE